MMNMLEVSSLQVKYSQKMTFEFLMIVAGADVNVNVKKLDASVAKFDKVITQMIDGDSKNNVEKPPHESLNVSLKQLRTEWTVFRDELSTNKTLFTRDESAYGDAAKALANFDRQRLMKVVAELEPNITTKSNAVNAMYTGYAEAADSQKPPAVTVLLAQQRITLMKMCKQAGWIAVTRLGAFSGGIAATYKTQVLESIAEFDRYHEAIVRGDLLLGLTQLSNLCGLNVMMKVSEQYRNLRAILQTIMDSPTVTNVMLIQLSTVSASLDVELAAAATVMRTNSRNCPEAGVLTDVAWGNVIAETGKQRMLTEKLFRHYHTVVRGIDVEANQAGMVVAAEEALNSLRRLIEGAVSLGIPSPPTQEIVDILLLALTSVLEQAQLFALPYTDPRSAGVIDNAVHVMNYMDQASVLYIAGSLVAFPDSRGVVMEISMRQQTLLQKMSKQAMLVSIAGTGKYSFMTPRLDAFKADLLASINVFEKSHESLLVGRAAAVSAVVDGVAQLFPSRTFARTNDACMLDRMMNTKHKFGLFKEQVIKMQTLSDAEIEAQQKMTDSIMLAETVGFYSSGTAICTISVSTDEWQCGISEAGLASTLLRTAEKNFILKASGLSQGWLAATDQMLVDFRSAVDDDASVPGLEATIGGFKDGWFGMGSDDIERSLALQSDYITQNPNPEGLKHLLDRAPGPQEYHASHFANHNVYRELLLSRNYEDVFIIDSRGNIVYTVNKDADFAMNVVEGPMSTTGLAQLYRAAEANMDVVHDTAWTEYPPAGNIVTSFVGKAVKSSAGMLVGVIAIMLPSTAMPIDSAKELTQAIVDFDAVFQRLKFGRPDDNIPSPPTTAVADKLFALGNSWETFKKLLQVPDNQLDEFSVSNLLAAEPAFLQASEELREAYVDETYAANYEIHGEIISLAAEQQARIQNLCKDVVLMQMGSNTVSVESLTALMTAIDNAQNVLVNGNARRLANHDEIIIRPKGEVVPNNDRLVVKLLTDFASIWLTMKEMLANVVALEVADPRAALTSAFLRSLAEATELSRTTLSQAIDFYSGKTEIVVLEPIHILAPMPMTGSWAAGATMKVSSLLSQGLINTDQVLLKGFALYSEFFDDKCDTTASLQIVLREQASTDKYVGLGGAGCSEVCAGTSFVASSIRLPFLSYGCAAATLSDTTAYPGFTRMSTVSTGIIPRILRQINDHYWGLGHVSVVSGDPSKYRTQGDAMVEGLTAQQFSADYVYAFESEWEGVVSTVDGLRMNKRRALFIIGTENFFRKLICASIVVEANIGITWLSEDAARSDWWAKTNSIRDSHISWVKEDSNTEAVKEALKDFKQGWASMGLDDDERRTALQALYITEQKDQLETIEGDEFYHLTHAAEHNVYRKLLVERGYMELFLFDIAGNAIYTVFKNSDYATNFAPNKNGEWENSGLATAFLAARDAPAEVASSEWAPYGPSSGALASFLAKAIIVDGNPVGFFATSLPSDAMSIQNIDPFCTMEAIGYSFEGALNFAGLGEPIPENINKQIPCFKGQTASGFRTLLDQHLAQGYPLGDDATKVTDPYNEVKASAADAICVFAYTLAHLMSPQVGYTIDEIRVPTQELYDAFNHHIKTQVEFAGASGAVKFHANDRPGYTGVRQVKSGKSHLVGIVDDNGTADFAHGGGPSNASWKPAFPDELERVEDFPYFAFQMVIPILCICCPTLAACIRNF
jgi:hypothetical protein